ncbi:MAG: hypothetical protein CV089_21970, partial [Nitrospira sp. WS110]|nr:hypothetical protein [Nitrospira sp. WS110]
RIARLTDARPIACTGRTDLHSPRLRRRIPPGTTYEVKDSVQRTGATSGQIFESLIPVQGFVATEEALHMW